MELKFTVDARKDLDWWKKNGSDAEKRKIKQLLTELEEHPRTGTGKPEQLTGCYSGIWSMVPMHNDINEITALNICKQLGIPPVKFN